MPSTTTAAESSAGVNCDVTQLTGGVAVARVGLSTLVQRATDAGADKDADEIVAPLSGAELRLTCSCRLNVVNQARRAVKLILNPFGELHTGHCIGEVGSTDNHAAVRIDLG